MISLTLKAQVVINEVCPANAGLIHDTQFYNFSPWVELYNKGNSAASVAGFFLSDDPEKKNKWRIPAGTTIPAKGYLLIWCDEMNTGLHTGFSLDAEGESVVLSKSDQTVVDRVDFPVQYTNVSYGRPTDGAAEWIYLTRPTPAAANNDSRASVRLDNPVLSLKSGRYTGAQNVTMTHSDAGVEIRYTLDGAEPTASSPVYSQSVLITQTTTIKAKAFRAGYIPSKAEVKTYFLNEHVFNLPVVHISTNPAYLWDDVIGIYTDGTNGKGGNCQSALFNWNQDWSRHAVIEFFDANGEKQFDQPVDIRIGGACSRGFPQKSIAVKARDKYGKNTIDETLFTTKENNSFGGFILRNSGNDFWSTAFRDALLQNLVAGQMDVDYLAYEPKIFYLNGQYWGIQNLREKIDADYIESNYGVDKDDLDLGEWESALEGSVDGYVNYLNALEASGPASPASFDIIDANIDVQAYINYLVAEIYSCNTDWPGNNVKYWRQHSTNGKWRWILWDMDFGFGLYSDVSYPTHPTLHFATATDGPSWPNPAWSTRHIRLVLANPEFRQRFIRTMTAAMGTTFHPSRVIHFVDSFQTRIATEYPYHANRWGLSQPNWSNEVQRMRDFAMQRHTFMKDYVRSFFGLGEDVRFSFRVTEPAGAIVFNEITTRDHLTDAPYYRGLEYTIRAQPDPGYRFSHWKISTQESETVTLIQPGDIWKYDDDGTEQAGWAQNSFDDTGWAEGPSQLGYGEGDEQTVVGFGPNAGSKHITTWFRKTFTVADTTGLGALNGTVMFDDGVIIYLNGVEIFRGNMPAGPATPATVALSAANENVYTTFSIPEGVILPGQNLIAAEVHQNGGSSSDLSFDLSLGGVRIVGDVTETTSTEQVITAIADSDVSIEAFFVPAPPAEGLVINEFSAVETSALDERGEAEDWIELLNTGSEPIDLAGMFITDNLNQRTKYRIKAGKNGETIIAPGEYKILWADEELTDGPLHVNIKLSDDGESIGLYQMVGGTLQVVGELSYPGYHFMASYSRIPDGTGPFMLTGKPTPMAANEFEVPVAVEEYERQKTFVFPNPTTGNVRIVSQRFPARITVCYLTGEPLTRFDVDSPDDIISLTDVPAGIYLFRIRTATGESVHKVVMTN